MKTNYLSGNSDILYVEYDELTARGPELVPSSEISENILFNLSSSAENEKTARERFESMSQNRVRENFTNNQIYPDIMGCPYYIDTFFACGGLLLKDISNSQIIRSDSSFFVDYTHTAFYFKGSLNFYLIIGRWRGEKIGLYIPEMNTFFAAQFIDRTDSTTLWTKNVISHLRNYEGSKAGLKDDNNVSENKTGSERIALQIGFHPNLGHYFWQEITGLQRILELYGTNSFDCILCGKYSRLRLDKLFPAIPSKKLITLDSSDSRELYEYTRNLSANIIRPVGCELNDYVRGNIYSYCQSELSSKKLCYINEVTSDFNFIWFNLRNHNKSWGGQVNGIIQIAKEMNKRYKNVGVLIDGFNDTESIASAIMEQIPNEIYVVNTIGCSFVESIVWANKVKTFCSVLGSGLVINSWLANGRGFSHGNVEHLKQARYWGSVNPSSEVYFLSPDNVVSNSGIYDNYDFDFNIALSCIDEIFHDLGVERK